MTESNEFDFPNFETYKSNLSALDVIDFAEYTPQDIYYKYFELAKTIPLCHKIFTASEFNKNVFFRARLNIKPDKEDISLVSTFSFPPNNLCNENNRANISTRTVFYCSNNPNSAIIECKPENGAEGFLGIWKANSKRSLKSGICLPSDLPNENQWKKIAEESYNHFVGTAKNNKYFEHLKALHHFMNFKFKYEPKPYHITSTIGHEILYGNSPHDFLIYSSAIDNRYCNMAFHPNVVLDNLELQKVIQFKIVDVESRIIKLGKLVGHFESSRLIWRTRSEQEEKLFKKL